MLSIQRMISPYNHYNYNSPKYLVFHYIGAKGTAKNNAVYFYNGDRQASAHYYIGETECWQGTEDFHGSWAVGNTRTEVNNTNSINIEMECANDELYITPITEQNAVELGAYLMKKYNIPIENVRTHYEVSGGTKICPNWSANNWERWGSFKQKLVAQLNNQPINQPSQSKPIEEPSQGGGKKYLYLKPHVSKWNVYPTNVAPIIGNQCGSLAPSQFGGLEYGILGNPQNDVYTIQTQNFGRVNIYVPRDSDSEFYTKGEFKPAQTQVSNNGKKYLNLKPHICSWRVYPLNRQPIVGNEVGSLAPANYGGLSYEVLEDKGDIKIIQTQSFGRVQIYAPRDNDSSITNSPMY